MSINWDDLVKDAGTAASSFEPLPESDYDLEVIEAKPKTTKDQTKKMYEVKSKVIGGEHAGRFIWDNIVLTTDNPNALGFFFRKMASMGLDGNYFASQKPSDEQICATLRGRRFRARIGQRVWQGNTKNEIKQYHSATASALPPSVATPQMAAPPPAAAPPAPSPAPAPTPAAPMTYEQPAAQPVAEQPAPPAPPAQDPWAAQAPAPAAGDPWAAQPQAQQPAPPPAAPPAPAPEQPAAPQPPVAQEQPPAPAPAPVQQPPAPAPQPAASEQAPPPPPAAPSVPF